MSACSLGARTSWTARITIAIDGISPWERVVSLTTMLPVRPLLVLLLTTATCVFAQGVREHTRPGETSDPARLRYRLGDNTRAAGAAVNDSQASDVTLTLNAVAVRPLQTWVRTAGRIDKAGKVMTASIQLPEASWVQVGQRVRAFSPESKSSMVQAWVTKVSPRQGGANVEVTLSGVGHPNSLHYVLEIVTVRGEFLSV